MTDAQPDLAPTTCVRQSGRQVHCRLGDVFVLMDTSTGEYFELNGAGSRLWEEVSSPVSVASLVAVLLRGYDVDPQTCETAVREWIGKMRSLGFLEVVPNQLGGV